MNLITTVADLPPELVHAFLEYLDPALLYFARQVCALWRALAVRLLRTPRASNLYHNFTETLIRHGYLALLRETIGLIFDPNPRTLNLAIFHGRLDVAGWLISCGADPKKISYHDAIASLDPPTIEFAGRFVEKKVYFVATSEWSPQSFEVATKYADKLTHQAVFGLALGAIKHQNLAALREIMPKFEEVDDPIYHQVLLDNAMEIGNLEITKFLLNRRHPLSECLIDSAADSGNRELIEFLLSHGYRWAYRVSGIVKHGFDFMMWCLDHGCPIRNCAASLFYNIGPRDRDEIFEYLDQYTHSNIGAPECRKIPEIAVLARNNTTGLLQALINRGFVWNQKNPIPCIPDNVRFLSERGLISWDQTAYVTAISRADLDFLRWAIDSGKKHPPIEKLEFRQPWLRRWFTWRLSVAGCAVPANDNSQRT
jgi:hypothetical protein